ncbi:MAG: transketolase [Candidatus Neomarinimicrobiota bacterium]
MSEQQEINELKGLIMDTVRKADSGHTGGPFSSADFAAVLYKDILRYDPDDPRWLNRDRFLLSAGHESALLYVLLHLIGYLQLDDLHNFRQVGSRTPGHPEYGLTPGVEATTGPLGQGVGMAVGLAVAEEMLRARLGEDVVDHWTYCLCSDGDLQEGVALGAAALAGHWRLGRLITFYDRNQVQISGGTDRVDATSFDQLFESFGWHVQVINGHDRAAIRRAITAAQAESDRSSLIIGNTTIGHGAATMAGQAATHGAPLPPEEIAATKEALGLDPEQFFALSEATTAAFRRRQDELRQQVAGWHTSLAQRREDPDFQRQWDRFFGPVDLPGVDWPEFEAGVNVATRKAFGQALEAAAKAVPNLVGGSADLEPSNNTGGFARTYGDFGARRRGGRSLAYGVREFPMGAINNGIALHGGLRPFGATFLVFTDYERPSIRLRALQQLPVLGVYTHDSVFLGEDGPTHQPVEHIMSLRAIPELRVYRPADTLETVVCLQAILQDDTHPAALLLTRQGVPVLPDRLHDAIREGVPRGGYVLAEPSGAPDITIFATGSEVSLALEVSERLPELAVRLVSLPCWELLAEQPEPYRKQILSDGSGLKVSLEAGATVGWERYVGSDGLSVGVDRFGASGPGKDVARLLGLTAEAVTKRILNIWKSRNSE